MIPLPTDAGMCSHLQQGVHITACVLQTVQPLLMELKCSQHERRIAWFPFVILVSWILLTGPPSYSPKVIFKPEKDKNVSMSICVCVFLYLSTCPCVFGHVSRINNSEPSSRSDLWALKVMIGNLSSKRKSILSEKKRNFLAEEENNIPSALS